MTTLSRIKHLAMTALAVGTLSTTACKHQSELYCNATEPCLAGHAYCDIEGVCPASEGIGNTCIPQPCWDAGPGQPDAGPGPDGPTADVDADPAALAIVSTTPVADETGVDQHVAIHVTFSHDLDSTTVDEGTFFVELDGAKLDATYSVYEDTATLRPETALRRKTRYDVTVTSGLESAGGRTLTEDALFSFDTRPGSWSSPTTIDSDSATASDVSVACNDANEAIAVWAQGDDIWHARFELGVGWGSASRIDNQSGAARAPQIASGGDDFMAVWAQRSGGRDDIWAARYSGSWNTPATVESNNEGTAYLPSVAMNSRGEAVVGWGQYDSSSPNSNTYATTYSPQGGWRTQTRIEDFTGWSDPPRVSINASGRALAVFGQDHNDDGTMYTWAGLATNGTWQGAVKIQSSNDPGGNPSALMRDDGTALAIWTQTVGPDDLRIYANHSPPALGWRTPQAIDDRSGRGLEPSIVAIGEDQAMATWMKQGDVLSNIYATSWGATTPIKTGTSGITSITSSAKSGFAAVVWRQDESVGHDVWAVPFHEATGWETAERVENLAGDMTSADLCVLPAGNVIAVFTDSNVNAVTLE